MPYFGLTSPFLSSPLLQKVCDLLRFQCAPCSGQGVQLTPVSLCALPPVFAMEASAYTFLWKMTRNSLYYNEAVKLYKLLNDQNMIDVLNKSK